ncbi:MAG TPA: A24 family peptidase [Gemmatimonadaceae bacterium]|nr:A24 family peptidase [Gemmatimonadaceae bacterium]
MMQFGEAPLGLLAGTAFTLMLASACAFDVRFRRIPNRLVAVLAVGGVLYAFSSMPFSAALLQIVGGGAAGLAIWLPFWMLRVLGAGDVKLAAAAGVWLGAGGVVEASLVGAAVGGGIAFWALARNGGIAAGTARFGAWLVASRAAGAIGPELTPRERRIPYGLAIAAGAVVAAWVPGLIW